MQNGLIEPGNIDLHNRPVVHNADGSISTVRSISVGIDGKEVLIPTVSPDGKMLTDDEAVALYKLTGQHLGKFDNPEDATAYAQQLHQSQADEYLPKEEAMPQSQSEEQSAKEIGEVSEGQEQYDPAKAKLAAVAQMLRDRGMLSQGGNLRMLPFGDGANPVSKAVNDAVATPASTTPDDPIVVHDNNGVPVVVDKNAKELPPNVPDSEWINVWPAVIGAGGAALGLLLGNYFKQKGITPPEVPPTGTGGLPAAANSNIPPNGGNGMVDGGDLTPVNPNGASATEQALIGGPKGRIGTDVPPNAVEAMGTPPQHLTSRQLAERRTKNAPGEARGTTTVMLPDNYSDLTPEEMAKAKVLAEQLVANRTAGNNRRYQKGKSGVGVPAKPTDAPDRYFKGEALDEQGAFNLVVRAIRDAKLKPSQLRAIAR